MIILSLRLESSVNAFFMVMLNSFWNMLGVFEMVVLKVSTVASLCQSDFVMVWRGF